MRSVRCRVVAAAGGLAAAAVIAGCSTSGSGSATPRTKTERVIAAARAIPGACAVKPSAATTGAHGTLKPSDLVVADKNGQTIENVELTTRPGDTEDTGLLVKADNVTVRNVRVDGRVLVTGDNVVLDHVTSQGVSVSSGMNTLIEFNDIGYTPADAMHVTSDGGRYIHGTIIRYNYLHDPRPPKSEHADGIQVRGVDTMSIVCNNIQGGPWQSPFNAAVFLENANGGDKYVSVIRNWLFGYAWTFMTGATDSRFEDNVIGGDIHWGTCYNMPPGMTFSSHGNVTATGAPIHMCAPKAGSS